MNLKRSFLLFISLCFTMIFWCGSASAASYEGKVDGGSGSTINGWAWDASAPDSPVDVTLSVIKVSDQSVAFTNTFTADQYRQDLENCGKGNGKHSFAITVPWKIQNTRSRSLPVEHRCLAPFTICQGLTVRRLPPFPASHPMDRPPIWVLLKPLLTVHVVPAQKAGGATPLPVPLPLPIIRLL